MDKNNNHVESENTAQTKIDRRTFITGSSLAAGAIVSGTVLPSVSAFANQQSKKQEKRSPNGSPYAKAWQFAPGLLYMNIGTTGSTPKEIIKKFNDDYIDIAQNPKGYLFGQQSWRNAMAPGFGCDPYELVTSFNTTDGMWRIVQGLTWEPGDEVISTNMEEDAGDSVLKLLADRYGVIVKRVIIPTNDAYSDEAIFTQFEGLLSNKTKAILFSSPIYLTGTRLPERDLCLWAASKGIISIVDGAHLTGMIAINLHDMGCDFFSGSGHKWQCGPGQTGFLYIRNGLNPNAYIRTVTIDDEAALFGFPSQTVDIPVPGYSNTTPLPNYYPSNTLIYIATSLLTNGVREPDTNIAAVLQFVGNGSRPAQKALLECCQLWDSWGRADIEDYIVSIAQYLRERLIEVWGPQALSMPYATSDVRASRVGLTSFNPFSPGFDYNAELTPEMSTAQRAASDAALAILRNDHKIVLRRNVVPHTLRGNPSQYASSTTTSTPLRISTHLFHSKKDIDRLIDALLQVVPHP